jgi:hypothetical protein
MSTVTAYRLVHKFHLLLKCNVCVADSESYYYTNQGQAPTVESIDDVEDFNNMCSALALMGIFSIIFVLRLPYDLYSSFTELKMYAFTESIILAASLFETVLQ